MDRDKFEHLMAKYKAGESSLAEEEWLVKHAEELDTDLGPWLKHIGKTKKKADVTYKETLWLKIESRAEKKTKRSWPMLAAAASVILLLSLFISFFMQKRNDEREKAALLHEALSMFPEMTKKKEQTKVIYEDELVIIFTKTE